MIIMRMFLFYIFIISNSLTPSHNMKDSRNKVDEYTNMFMLFCMQNIHKSNDSKSFVDKPLVSGIEEITDELVEILKKYSSKEDVKIIDDLISNHKEMGMLELSNSIDSLFSRLTKNGTDKLDSECDESLYQSPKDNDGNLIRSLDEFIARKFNKEGEDFEDAEIPDTMQANLLENQNKSTNVNDERNPSMEDSQSNQQNNSFCDIKNKDLINMLKEIKEINKKLYKKDKKGNDYVVSSLIKLRHPFTIPGGRFRETYYWDNYWIVDGQLYCDMKITVMNCLNNFIDLINKYGFIPNGTRKYYEGRSQPPMFTQMVYNYYSKLNKKEKSEFKLESMLEALEKEYEFWMTYRVVKFKYNNKDYELNQYCVETDYPRPESLTEDINTFKEYLENKTEEELKNIGLEKNKLKEMLEMEKFEDKYKEYLKKNERIVFSNLKSAAESGWDFSTRFFKDKKNLWSICTNEIIPADLNSILYKNEILMAKMFKICENNAKYIFYTEKAKNRMESINEVLWKENSWYDYNFKQNKHTIGRFYFSNIMPMVFDINPPNGKTIYHVLDLYKKELFGYEGGIPSSGEGIGSQQCDFPNVWAPHQELIIKFLLSKNETKMAFHIAKSFYDSVNNNFVKKTPGEFYEKYNCLDINKTGGDGEYKVQIGFGWTNGVIVNIICNFGDKLCENRDFYKSYDEIITYLKEKSEKVNNEKTSE